jgi:hypothetical protein
VSAANSSKQRLTVHQVHEKTALHHQEEFVRRRMMVPGEVSVEDGEPKAVPVHAVDHDVAVFLICGVTLRDKVHHLKGRVPDRLVLVGFGTEAGVLHLGSFPARAAPPRVISIRIGQREYEPNLEAPR